MTSIPKKTYPNATCINHSLFPDPPFSIHEQFSKIWRAHEVTRNKKLHHCHTFSTLLCVLIIWNPSFLHEKSIFNVESILFLSFNNVAKVHLRFGLLTLHWGNFFQKLSGRNEVCLPLLQNLDIVPIIVSALRMFLIHNLEKALQAFVLSDEWQRIFLSRSKVQPFILYIWPRKGRFYIVVWLSINAMHFFKSIIHAIPKRMILTVTSLSFKG